MTTKHPIRDRQRPGPRGPRSTGPASTFSTGPAGTFSTGPAGTFSTRPQGPRSTRPWRLPPPAVALLGLLALLPPALAEGVETVVITGSTTERRVAEAPYAIGVVDRDTLRGATRVR